MMLWKPREVKHPVIYPAFNYMGMKTRLIPEIHRITGSRYTAFVDVFSGSGAMSINSPSPVVVMNDRIETLAEFYKWCMECDLSSLYRDIYSLEEEFPNTLETFDSLRHSYEKDPSMLKFWYISYRSYNSSPKFSPDGKLRASSRGKGYEDHVSLDTMIGRLHRFCLTLREKKVFVFNEDFREFIRSCAPHQGELWYFDPPYRGSDADYTDGWTREDEEDLFRVLEVLQKKKVRFALSYCIENKGWKNEEFVSDIELFNRVYGNALRIHHLDISYKTCSHMRHTENGDFSDEVLITNF